MVHSEVFFVELWQEIRFRSRQLPGTDKI